MKRSGPLQVDPDKTRAWQQESARRYAQKARQAPREPRQGPVPQSAGRRAPRRNDGPWRAACIALYGNCCRACGSGEDIQMDHMKPRSQGGPSVVENGLPLCRYHHEAKTAGTLQIRPEWLTVAQQEWLAADGWVAWDEQGQPYGPGWKHFAPRRSRA